MPRGEPSGLRTRRGPRVATRTARWQGSSPRARFGATASRTRGVPGAGRSRFRLQVIAHGSREPVCVRGGFLRVHAEALGFLHSGDVVPVLLVEFLNRYVVGDREPELPEEPS